MSQSDAGQSAVNLTLTSGYPFCYQTLLGEGGAGATTPKRAENSSEPASGRTSGPRIHRESVVEAMAPIWSWMHARRTDQPGNRAHDTTAQRQQNQRRQGHCKVFLHDNLFVSQRGGLSAAPIAIPMMERFGNDSLIFLRHSPFWPPA